MLYLTPTRLASWISLAAVHALYYVAWSANHKMHLLDQSRNPKTEEFWMIDMHRNCGNSQLNWASLSVRSRPLSGYHLDLFYF